MSWREESKSIFDGVFLLLPQLHFFNQRRNIKTLARHITVLDDLDQIVREQLNLLVGQKVDSCIGHFFLGVKDDLNLGTDDAGQLGDDHLRLDVLGHRIDVLQVLSLSFQGGLNGLFYLPNLVTGYIISVATFFQLVVLLFMLVGIVEGFGIIVVQFFNLFFQLLLFGH